MKTLTKNWRDHVGQAHEHTHKETKSKYLNRHGCISQSEESKCMWAHDRDGVSLEFLKGATRGLQEEWMGGNLKGDYLRLMPGLCLEDRMN